MRQNYIQTCDKHTVIPWNREFGSGEKGFGLHGVKEAMV